MDYSEVVAKHSEHILDGLNSRKSYAVVYTNKEKGLHIGVRLFPTRVSDYMLWIGGKLRVAYDYHYKKIEPPRIVNKEGDEGALADMLAQISRVKWMRKGMPRASTVVGYYVAAGINDIEFLDPHLTNVCQDLLTDISSLVGLRVAKSTSVPVLQDITTVRLEEEDAIYKAVTRSEAIRVPGNCLGMHTNLINKATNSGKREKDKLAKIIEPD